MKSRILKTSLGSIIFLTLVIAVIALIHPVYVRVNGFLTSESFKIIKNLKTKTGLEINYQKLSPSILSGINIQGISVNDSVSGNSLLSINKATFSYRLKDFFTGTPVNGIKQLVLDGVTVEYDVVKDNSVMENFKYLLNGDKNLKDNKKSKEQTKKTLLLNGMQINVPFDVQFKNISLHYSDSKNDFLATIKNILLEKNPSSDTSVLIKTSGRLDFRTDLVKSGKYRRLFACGFDVSGILFKNLEGTSFLLKLSEISRADYTLSKMELLLNCSDSKFSFRTMKNVLPYSILAEADLNLQKFKLEGTSNNFEILKLIKIKNNSKIYSKFAGTTVSGNISAETSFAGNTTLLKSLKLNLDGLCHLTKKSFGKPVNIEYSMDCKNQVISVNKLKADGELIGVDFSGNYNIAAKQPSGVLSLDHLVLKNGGVLQTEVYIDPYKNGFMFFAPQFYMNEKSLTAIQFTVLPSTKSVDFRLEFDDYSHSEYEKSGHVTVDGSFLNEKNRLVQASVSVNDMFVESVLNTAAFFLPENKSSGLKKLASSVSTYIFSDDVYFTTDFKSFSFNSPLFLVANTAKERQLLTFAVDGSNQTISLSNMDLQFGNQTAHVSAGLDFNKGFKDFNFYSELLVNSLPYNFNGSFSSNFLNISGDYDFNTAITIKNGINGSVEFSSLPVAAGKNIFAASSNCNFSWSVRSGFEMDISRFDIDEPSGTLKNKPHLTFTGSANKYGFVMNKLTYSDTSSALDGKMNVVWNLNGGVFDSIIVDFDAANINSREKITVNAEITNPEKKLIDVNTVKNDFYVSAQGTLASFPVSRFMQDQGPDNVINTDFSITGTAANPFFNLRVFDSNLNIGGSSAILDGMVVLDDTGFTVSELNFDWKKIKLHDTFGVIDLKTFTGDFSTAITGKAVNLSFDIPLNFKISSLSPENKPQKNLVLAITSPKMSGSLFPSDQKLDVVITKTPGQINVISAQGRGVSAQISDNKFITASSGPDSLLSFNLNGSVINNALDISITNIHTDLKKLCQNYSIPFVSFTAGTLSGAVKLKGLTTDPEYTGAITVVKPEFYVPFVSKKVFRTDRLFATAGQNHLVVKPTPATVDKNPVTVSLDIEFDRWKIAYLDCQIETKSNEFIPVDMKFPFIRYKGYAGFENFLIHLVPGNVTFTGTIIGDKADVEVVAAKVDPGKKPPLDILVKLDLIVKNRVQIVFNPLLRGVIVPGNSMGLFLDTRTGDFGAKGEVSLRGGEISWLNRTFYMKEGKVVFNESKGLFDPRITVRAETRERDESNNQVTVILSANGQTLSQFNPRFSSSPAKSENEIMELLGQVISSDSENVASLAMAGGDYLMQATVMRGVENTLRELCNFDIFSIRTNILQNAVKQSLDKNSGNKQITFSNFFDNSAVYVGKYFGSAMYVDALMHWSYDETKVGEEDSVNGLILQPEFGLEMTSPFVNIRLGVAPDLEAIKNSLWMPSTSITLSWKHSF